MTEEQTRAAIANQIRAGADQRWVCGMLSDVLYPKQAVPPCMAQVAMEATKAVDQTLTQPGPRRQQIMRKMVADAQEKCKANIQWLYDELERRGWFRP